jgi:phosphate transport system permease protein
VVTTQVPGMPLEMQFGAALVLLMFVLSLNAVATIIRSRFRRRRTW